MFCSIIFSLAPCPSIPHSRNGHGALQLPEALPDPGIYACDWQGSCGEAGAGGYSWSLTVGRSVKTRWGWGQWSDVGLEPGCKPDRAVVVMGPPNPAILSDALPDASLLLRSLTSGCIICGLWIKVCQLDNMVLLGDLYFSGIVEVYLHSKPVAPKRVLNMKWKLRGFLKYERI